MDPSREQKLVLEAQPTTEMEEAEKEIVLSNSALNSKLQAYSPKDIDEFDIDEKVYLKKFKEIDQIQADVAMKIAKFFIEFPENGRRHFYENLRLKALSNVSNHRKLVKARVIQVKRNKISKTNSQSADESSLERRKAEAMEKAIKIVAETKRYEREKSVLKAKSVCENVRADVHKLDEKVTELEVDKWSEGDDYSISKGVRKIAKWGEDLEKIITMLGELEDLKVEYEHVESEVKVLEKKFKEVEITVKTNMC